MRPQHITAENACATLEPHETQYASMRPQHITAENLHAQGRRGIALRASMRPQHITAENPSPGASNESAPAGCFNEAAAYNCGKRESNRGPRCRCGCGFNEAAAYNCGKPQIAAHRRQHLRGASMRPQHITAENRYVRLLSGTGYPCFNEAAAYNCGKRAATATVPALAAGASMRPQHITAENAGAHSNAWMMPARPLQ